MSCANAAASGGPGFNTSGAFSPDGRFVAYVTPAVQVVVQGFPDGPAMKVVSPDSARATLES